MSPASAWHLAKAAASAWVDDYAPSMGAALAYYTLFSVAPLLLIVISIAGLVFGTEAARAGIFDQLQQLMGQDGALAISALLESVDRPKSGIVASAVGGVVLLVGATSVYQQKNGSTGKALRRVRMHTTSHVNTAWEHWTAQART